MGHGVNVMGLIIGWRDVGCYLVGWRRGICYYGCDGGMIGLEWGLDGR